MHSAVQRVVVLRQLPRSGPSCQSPSGDTVVQKS